MQADDKLHSSTSLPQSSTLNSQSIYDLLVIGGGINGAGIANDAAGRGLSVALCEQDDLASGTSWKSSKLIHGGLRYLEYYEFNMVRKALREREILLRKAPHIIWPLAFVMPHDKTLRPAWLIRIGLFLYDHLGKRKLLPGSKHIDLSKDPAGKSLKQIFKTGFTYADCYAEDSRLVVLNVIQAKQLGATILTRTKLIAAERKATHWEVTLQNTNTGKLQTLSARMLVNAAGPWVDDVLKNELKIPSKQQLTLVKGSHIVVPKLYAENYAYILQNTDKRIIFIIPFEEKYSLIGTTDAPFTGDLHHVAIDDAEINYLCAAVNRYLQKPITPQEIVWTFSGVRPLKKESVENLSAITRDYSFELNNPSDAAPLISVFGGKLTTYRELAEELLNILNPFFSSMGAPWTANRALPGGGIPDADFGRFLQKFRLDYPWLPEQLATRYAHNYGTSVYLLLKDAHTINDLGKPIAAGLYQREVQYLIEHEFAQTAEDILWRRTKLGLEFTPMEVMQLNKIMEYLLT